MYLPMLNALLLPQFLKYKYRTEIVSKQKNKVQKEIGL